MSNEHTWDKYQKLILEELKSLRKGQDKISKDVADLKETVATFESTKEFVGELKKIATLRQTEEIYEVILYSDQIRILTLNAALQVY